jgi:hypothetical protein
MKKSRVTAADELLRVREAIDSACAVLDECRDPRLFEAAAYELKYLRARQDWLFEAARRERSS